MKRHLLLSLALVLVAATASAQIEGPWTAHVERNDALLRINLRIRPNWNNDQTFRITDLAGLTREQIDAKTMTPVAFRIEREAGTFAFEGSFRNSVGSGQFTFAPNRDLIAKLRGMGLRPEKKDADEVDDYLLFLGQIDLSTAYVKAMQELGYRVDLEKFIEMRMFGVTPQFIRELADAGYRNIPAEKLVQMKMYGIDAIFIKRMSAVQ